MGNSSVSVSSLNIDFKRPTYSNAKILHKCNGYTGTQKEILALYYRFMNIQQGKTLEIKEGLLNLLFRNTNLRGFEMEISNLFGTQKKINVMELLAVVTVYSSLRWEVKVKLGVYMFDFDGDKCLSKDELTVLVSSFFEGLSKVTENPSLDQFTLRSISKTLIKAAAPAQPKKVQSNE